ncbi:GAP family protein [Subtercola sp. PAMC28395]|uniref:GAP family protein n=1 Tax=Subtercola sp. PAMC28395 TaxID=2846775 RepID=UPI001C0DB12E|nr:GAP family protein [Subtercola sp. PAMC28395]QWT22979.1 GAP family protein [Subtercola sp. PAMC28395]
MFSTLVVALPLAVGALLASLPVVAMAAVLATVNTRPVLRSFTLGWLAGITATALVGLLVVDLIAYGSGSSSWLSWLRIALGVMLLALAVRKFVKRPRVGDEPTNPAWMTAMQKTTARRAFRIAFLLGSVNPKNAVIVLSVVSAVVAASPVVAWQLLSLLVFIVVASLGVVAPAVALRAFGDRAAAPLNGFVAWFARYSDIVLAIVILALGVLVLSNGVGGVLASS